MKDYNFWKGWLNKEFAINRIMLVWYILRGEKRGQIKRFKKSYAAKLRKERIWNEEVQKITDEDFKKEHGGKCKKDSSR